MILSGGGARGAYQIGVWKYLQERKWKPDLICGTSIGALNAVAIASHFSIDELSRLWLQADSSNVYKFSLWQQIRSFLFPKSFVSFLDTQPLKHFLTGKIEPDRLRQSDIEVVITATNLLKADLEFFTNKVISLEHVMAATAFPILFPWQYIKGVPYWDGGVMMNTPILPALERKAKEIIVVFLSPIGGLPTKLPESRIEAVQLLSEMTLIASYQSSLNQYKTHASRKGKRVLLKSILPFDYGEDVKIYTVSPPKMMGLNSILHFSKERSRKFITRGYKDAAEQLELFW